MGQCRIVIGFNLQYITLAVHVWSVLVFLSSLIVRMLCKPINAGISHTNTLLVISVSAYCSECMWFSL